jgi:hypothetical protein
MLRKTLWTAAALLLAILAGIFVARTDATAQIRAALVRDVDEPARVPYEFEVAPTRPFLNVYHADFPAVPAGKRLKLTRISGFIWSVNSSNSGAFVAVNDPGGTFARVGFPIFHQPMAYWGTTYSFNIGVDYVFEAGQSPRVEMGVSAGTGGLPNPSPTVTRFRAHGYLVDLSL